MAEVEAASGNVPVVQIGGGVDDGFVYVLNNSNQDVSTAITSYIQMELSEDGEYVHLGDMVFQTSFISRFKSKRWLLMVFHIIIWTGTVCLVLYFTGLLKVWHIIFLVVVHFVTDSWKSRQPKDEKHFWYIYIDQFVHFAQMVVVWL